MDNIEKLKEIKQFVLKLSSKKTKLNVNDVVFEFAGELEEGTELSFIENGEDVTELELEDGRKLSIEDNIVTSIEELSSEEESEEEDDEVDEDQAELDLEEDESEESEDVDLEEESEDEDVDLEEDDEEEENDDEIDIDEQISTLQSDVEVLRSRMDDMREDFDSALQMVQDLVTVNETLTKKVEKLSKEPAVEGDEREVSNNFNKTKSKNRVAKIFATQD